MATRKTLCFTGMDAADESALNDMFARAASGRGWNLAPESSADVLVIDVDSIYGHMTWLRTHNSERTIVALSGSEKSEADLVLTRPVTIEKISAMLAALDGDASAVSKVAAPLPPQAVPEPARAASPEPRREPVPPQQPEPAPPRTPAPDRDPQPEPAPPPVREPEPQPEPERAAPPREPMLADYFERGALPGPVKIEAAGAPALVLDPQHQQYIGPTALKPLIPYCKRVIRPQDWTAITPAELEKLRASQPPQPLARLLWLFALVNGEGQLAVGFDLNKKFRLTKWPQIEREYPKHFRIATVMMKQPALLTEIAEQSGAPLAEVTDFVNAYLATGFAEMEEPPAPVDVNAQKAGFLGRLRGLRNG